jgi:hypothetical protein
LIAADRFGCGSKYLVEMVVERKGVVAHIIFPVAQMGHLHGVGQLHLQVFEILIGPFFLGDIHENTGELIRRGSERPYLKMTTLVPVRVRFKSIRFSRRCHTTVFLNPVGIPFCGMTSITVLADQGFHPLIRSCVQMRG